MARLSRRTMAKVETWVDKQKTSKLRKLLIEGWVYEYDPREIEDMSDEEIRELILTDVKSDDDHVDAALETIGIEVEYSDDAADLEEDDDEDASEEE